MRDKRKYNVIPGIILILLLSISLLFQQCSREERLAEKRTSEHDDEHEDEVVNLTDEELYEFGIELATAGSGLLQQHMDLTGEIIIDPGRLAHIVPRFPGIVKEVRKKIGNRVQKGEVLAIIESNESLSSYEVISLIQGTVIDMHLTLGEVVSDASHTFTIADLSKVWVNLSIYQKDLPYINLNQTVIISAGPNMKEAIGKITYITPIIEEKTRTATARVELPNPDGYWKPGLFVTGRVITDEVEVPIRVPKTALEMMENQTVVFIKTDKGFRPQPVLGRRENEKFVEIISGLEAGQEYVAKNGFIIKAELGKNAFSDEH